MDVLETMLRAAVQVLNRNIPEVTRARELCGELAGTTVAVRVANTGLAAYFTVHEDSLSLASEMSDEPDVCVSGSLLDLARMAGSGDAGVIRSGAVELVGDVETAQAFQALLTAARPDPEEGLSSLVGDAVAHKVGELGRSARRWADDAGSNMSANIREYLQEESRDAPSRYEVERFANKVATLRDDVERLAARIRRLSERAG